MTSSTPSTPPSERARVRRAAERGHYDSETVHAIIDAAWVCHVAFADTAEPDSPRPAGASMTGSTSMDPMAAG
jgi:hypothetical protein